MLNNIWRTAIYWRISTESQEDWMSLESQRQACLEFAEKNWIKINEDFIFLEQYSWGDIDRPWFNKVLELAKNWKISSLLILKRDRLARENYVYHTLLKKLSDYNIKVFFVAEILTWDKALTNFIWATFANFWSFERDMIQYRTYMGKRAHLKANKWVFSSIPYWYVKNLKTKELEIFESEKKIILMTVSLFLEEWLTLWAIAKKYSQENIPPPSMSDKWWVHQLINQKLRKNAVNHWTEVTVYRILKKASMYVWIYQAFTKEYKKIGNKSVLIWERPKEDWINVKIPQILTKKQAEAINEKLEHNRVFSKKRSVRTYMLQWKLLCDCETIHHNFIWYTNNKKNLKNYRCSKYNLRKNSIDRHCKNHISWLKIEWIIVDTIKELLLHPDYLFEEAIRELTTWNEDIVKKDRYHELYWLITDIESKHKRNEDLYIEWNISKERFLEKKKELEVRKEEYSVEIKKEHEIIKNVTWREFALRDLKEIIEDLTEIIEKFFQYASYEKLKEMVEIIVDKVIIPVDRENPVRIFLKIPFRADFAERYLEEEMITFEDKYWKSYNIMWTWNMVPKLLNLDPTKAPLKFRTVEFNNSDDEDWIKYEDMLLGMMKDFFHQPYMSDQYWKTDFLNRYEPLYERVSGGLFLCSRIVMRQFFVFEQT